MSGPDRTPSPSATGSSTDDMPGLHRPALAATLSSSSGVSNSSTGSFPVRGGGILLHHPARSPTPSLSTDSVESTYPYSLSSSSAWSQGRSPPRKQAVSFAPLPPPPRERRNSITIGVAARGHMLATQQGGGGGPRAKNSQQDVMYIQMSDEDWEAYKARYSTLEDGSGAIPDIGTFAVQSSKKLFSKIRSLSAHSQTSSSSTPSNSSSGRRSFFSSTKASAGSSSDQDPSRSVAPSSSRLPSSGTSAVGTLSDSGSSLPPSRPSPSSGEPSWSYSQTPKRCRSPPPPSRPRSPSPSALSSADLSSVHSIPSISIQSDPSDGLSDMADEFEEGSDEYDPSEDAFGDENGVDMMDSRKQGRKEEEEEEEEAEGERRFSLGELNEALYPIAKSQEQEQEHQPHQKRHLRREPKPLQDPESDPQEYPSERSPRRNPAFLAQQHWWLDDQKYAPSGMVVGNAGTADGTRSGEITPRRRTSFGDDSRVGAVLSEELSTEGRTPSRAFVLGFDKLDADRAPAN